jgi:hypothetical protein
MPSKITQNLFPESCVRSANSVSIIVAMEAFGWGSCSEMNKNTNVYNDARKHKIS